MIRWTLPSLMNAVGLQWPDRLPPIDLRGIRLDSRQVSLGDLFLAIPGTNVDGRSFVKEAIDRGAAVVLCEGTETSISIVGKSICLAHPNVSVFVGQIFDAWYGFPSKQLSAYGVTGTNGKSTTLKLMAGILRAANHSVISLGTIQYEIGEEILSSSLTTPSTDVFFELLARGVSKGCDSLVMEVSSHALSQNRIRGMRFKRALFTNLTQDHFDFHAGFEDYFAAKKKLFLEYLESDGVGIINLDSPYGLRLAQEWGGLRLTFSRFPLVDGIKPDVVALDSEMSLTGSRFQIGYQGQKFEVKSKLIGLLNVENILAAIAFGFSLNLKPNLIASGIAGVVVPGRNEVFPISKLKGCAVVDYAHSPDALERVLQSLRPLTSGKLWCVFGCGGDRDRKKRPLMGAIAERLADCVVLTSDNPRTENPKVILDEIRVGLTRPSEVQLQADRHLAIRFALESMGTGDCVLVAGKGHEDYQIIGTEKHHFSDQEEIQQWLIEKGPAWN